MICIIKSIRNSILFNPIPSHLILIHILAIWFSNLISELDQIHTGYDTCCWGLHKNRPLSNCGFNEPGTKQHVNRWFANNYNYYHGILSFSSFFSILTGTQVVILLSAYVIRHNLAKGKKLRYKNHSKLDSQKKRMSRVNVKRGGGEELMAIKNPESSSSASFFFFVVAWWVH